MKKIIMMAALAAVATGAQAGLVHHWEFNGDATDSAGANDGTLNGGSALVASGSGYDGSGYLTVDGSASSGGSYVSTGLTYDPDSTFSWSVWARTANEAKVNGIIVGSRRNGAGTNTDFSPREFVKVTQTKTVFRPDDTANDVDYTDLTVAGGWTHLAVVKSGNTVTAYENGVAGTPVTLSGDFTEAAMPFFIGGEAGLTGGEFFDGDIDDVRIFDNALTASEVAALIPEPGTLGLVAAFGGGILFIRRRFMI